MHHYKFYHKIYNLIWGFTSSVCVSTICIVNIEVSFKFYLQTLQPYLVESLNVNSFYLCIYNVYHLNWSVLWILFTNFATLFQGYFLLCMYLQYAISKLTFLFFSKTLQPYLYFNANFFFCVYLQYAPSKLIL